MKILVLCEHGNNRSVTIAHQLKYWGHDVLPAGFKTTSIDTLIMLLDWADRIIVVEAGMENLFPFRGGSSWLEKTQVWDIGPDVYPRPFNKELLAKVKTLMQEHADEYKPKAGD